MAVRLTRRSFLRAAAAAAVGATLLPRIPVAGAEEQGAEPPELPWTKYYTKLDPEESRRRGHLGYYLFECAGGALWSIVSQLQEKVGYPWTLFPIPSLDQALKAVKEKKHLASLFQYGYGGAVGWGTLCGAINGSLFVVQMIGATHKIWDTIGKWLMRIYETIPFPSKYSNEMVVNGKALVPRERLKSSKWLPSNVSGSTLCHVSVGKWCEVSGYASGSAERSERCGRLTGDMAAITTEILNAYYDIRKELGAVEPEDDEELESKILARLEGEVKRIVAKYGADTRLSATTASCRVCHYKGKDYEFGQFTRGYLACESCHRDMRPHAHTFFNPLEAPAAPRAETQNERQLKEAAVGGTIASVAIGAIAGFTAAKAGSKAGKESK